MEQLHVFDLGQSIPNELSTQYDVCIIGSGPAGMTVAAELAQAGLRICVLESGVEKKSKHGDRLRAVQSTGEIFIKPNSRERVFGGASTTWAGLAAPLDEIDFAQRSPEMYWPIPRTELLSYYRAASERYGFAPPELLDPTRFKEVTRVQDPIPFSGLEEKVFIASDPAWNFGAKLKPIFAQENVHLYLDATVTSLASTTDEHEKVRVTHARIRTHAGRTAHISARTFVVACGGIENARLLLLSQDTNPTGLGNEQDQVGRYLMNHPKDSYGRIILKKPVRSLPYLFGNLHRGWAGYIGLRIPEQEQHRLGILNAYVRFEPLYPWTDSLGVWSFVMMVKRMRGLLDFWKRRQKNTVVEIRDYSETGDEAKDERGDDREFRWANATWNVLKDFPAVMAYAISRLSTKEPLIKAVRIRNFMEMEPRPENRITLGTERDANNLPIPVVSLSTSDLDRKSLVAVHTALASDVAKLGFGTLESNLHTMTPWPITFDASHHLGTTRMGTDPHTSVVDPNLRVHTVSNLYMAGGSVLPTSGNANPTYTICALSIRLAKYLKTQL